MKNNKFFRSHIRIEIIGYNQIKLLNELKKEGIRVKNVRKIDFSHMLITIEKKDSEKSFAIFKRMCYTYSVVVYLGVVSLIKKLLRRVGVLVGVALAVAVALVSSLTLSKVEVTGAPPAICSLVKATLKSEGTKKGSLISRLDKAQIRKVVNSIEGVAECSVTLDGTRLIVSLTKRETSEQQNANFTTIVADKDAIVTKVVCRSGTAKVKNGDIVVVGQSLIDGALYDAEGKVIKAVSADGEVYGIVSSHHAYLLSTTVIEYARTGKRKTETVLSVGKLKIGNKKSPYAYYESETESKVLSGLFPIKVTRTVYYETSMRQVMLTEEELLKIARERAKEDALAVEGDKVKSSARLIANGLYEISVYIEREGLISKGQ